MKTLLMLGILGLSFNSFADGNQFHVTGSQFNLLSDVIGKHLVYPNPTARRIVCNEIKATAMSPEKYAEYGISRHTARAKCEEFGIWDMDAGAIVDGPKEMTEAESTELMTALRFIVDDENWSYRIEVVNFSCGDTSCDFILVR